MRSCGIWVYCDSKWQLEDIRQFLPKFYNNLLNHMRKCYEHYSVSYDDDLLILKTLLNPSKNDHVIMNIHRKIRDNIKYSLYTHTYENLQ